VFSFSFLFECIQCAVFLEKNGCFEKKKKDCEGTLKKLGDMNGKFFSLVKKNYN